MPLFQSGRGLRAAAERCAAAKLRPPAGGQRDPLRAAASFRLRAPFRGFRASGSTECERAGREEREGIALSGCGAARGSPGSWQTVCGDVTPEFQTMINMIICIKFEWVLVFRENASDDECS